MNKRDQQEVVTEMLNEMSGSRVVDVKDSASEEEIRQSQRNLRTYAYVLIGLIILIIVF